MGYTFFKHYSHHHLQFCHSSISLLLTSLSMHIISKLKFIKPIIYLFHYKFRQHETKTRKITIQGPISISRNVNINFYKLKNQLQIITWSHDILCVIQILEGSHNHHDSPNFINSVSSFFFSKFIITFKTHHKYINGCHPQNNTLHSSLCST